MKKLYLFLLCLFACLSVSATVIVTYTTTSVILAPSGYLFVDINNNGFNDFMITAGQYNPDIIKIKALNAGSKVLTDGNGNVAALNDGVPIGSNFGSQLWADSAVIYRWDGGIYPYPLHTNKSIGLQISISGNTHYGYIYSHASMDQFFYGFYLERFAYEDLAGATINAASIATGTIEEQIATNLSISESNDWLDVDFGKSFRSNISLYDIAGHKVNATQIDGAKASIPMAAHGTGIYLLRLEIALPTGNVVLTKKFYHVR